VSTLIAVLANPVCQRDAPAARRRDPRCDNEPSGRCGYRPGPFLLAATCEGLPWRNRDKSRCLVRRWSVMGGVGVSPPQCEAGPPRTKRRDSRSLSVVAGYECPAISVASGRIGPPLARRLNLA